MWTVDGAAANRLIRGLARMYREAGDRGRHRSGDFVLSVEGRVPPDEEVQRGSLGPRVGRSVVRPEASTMAQRMASW